MGPPINCVLPFILQTNVCRPDTAFLIVAAAARQETVNSPMPRTRRHLNILALATPLHRQASALQGDVNASYLMVHTAMAKAMAEPQGPEPAPGELAATIHADLLETFEASEASEASEAASPRATGGDA